MEPHLNPPEVVGMSVWGSCVLGQRERQFDPCPFRLMGVSKSRGVPHIYPQVMHSCYRDSQEGTHKFLEVLLGFNI